VGSGLSSRAGKAWCLSYGTGKGALGAGQAVVEGGIKVKVIIIIIVIVVIISYFMIIVVVIVKARTTPTYATLRKC